MEIHWNCRQQIRLYSILYYTKYLLKKKKKKSHDSLFCFQHEYTLMYISLTRGFPVRPSKRSKSFLPSFRSVNMSLTGGVPLCGTNKQTNMAIKIAFKQYTPEKDTFSFLCTSSLLNVVDKNQGIMTVIRKISFFSALYFSISSLILRMSMSWPTLGRCKNGKRQNLAHLRNYL